MPANRRRRRPGAVLAAALLPLAVSNAIDVPAQLYSVGSGSAPPVPSTLNAVLESALGSYELSELSPALQRALLWDAGWLRVQASSSSSFSGSSASGAVESMAQYVQVFVPCGQTMDDVFLSSASLANASTCTVAECANNGGFTNATCSTTALETLAQCAIAPLAVSAVANVSGPTVALDGAIDSDFDPQVLRYVGDLEEEMYLIAERGDWLTNEAFCRQSPFFITPCRAYNTGNSSSGSSSGANDTVGSLDGSWCEPARIDGVAQWLQNELADVSSNSEKQVGGVADASDGSDEGADTPLLIGIIASVVVMIIIISVPFAIAGYRARAARRQHGRLTSEMLASELLSDR